MSAQRDGLLKQCPCDPARWPKCPHSWHLKMRHNGARYSISLHKYAKRRGLAPPRLRGDAEDLFDRLVREIETGTYQDAPAMAVPPAAPTAVTEGLTFDHAWPKFVDAVFESDMVSLEDERRRYRKMADVSLGGVRLGMLKLTAITEDHVETVYKAATKNRANSTKRKFRGALKRLLKWCVAKKHLAVSPITDQTVLRAGSGAMRTRRVRPDEEANLVEAANEGRSDAAQRLAAIIVAALDLGARLGELLALQWRDILFDFGRVSVRAVEAGARKNRKARLVPLTPRLVTLLRTLQVAAPTSHGWLDTDYVFGDASGGRVANIRKAWMTCVLRAHNVPPAWTGTALAADVLVRFKAIGLHFHDLRHECALRWLERGYTLSTIARLLGHGNLDTLRVYLGIEQEDALAEAERINAELAAGRPRGTKPALNPGRRGFWCIDGKLLLSHKRW